MLGFTDNKAGVVTAPLDITPLSVLSMMYQGGHCLLKTSAYARFLKHSVCVFNKKSSEPWVFS